MEHTMAFVETFSAFVFKPGTLGPVGGVLEQAWALVVKLVIHYCRSDPTIVTERGVERKVDKGTPESARIGAELGLELATLMEENEFPDTMFTSNLHLICCR
jgi:hypothetical protein